MSNAAAATSSVRITTIPRDGPFRVGQTVLFICEVEPAQSANVTYHWRTVEYAYGGTNFITETETLPRFIYIDDLRYSWYFCTATLIDGTVLGSADKLVEFQGKL